MLHGSHHSSPGKLRLWCFQLAAWATAAALYVPRLPAFLATGAWVKKMTMPLACRHLVPLRAAV
jgi:hypothetical protein